MAESTGYNLGVGFIHATVSFDGIGKQIAQEMRKAQKPAQEGGKDAGEKFQGGFGKGLRGVSERIREAVVSPTATAAAAAGGAAAGAAWSQGFKRAIDTKGMTRAMGSMVAALSGARVLKDVGSGFKDFVTNLDRSVPRIGAVSVGLMTLGGAGIAAVGGLLGVVNSLGSIAAVGLTLPGLIGAGAASMAVFTMAMMDVTTVLADLGPKFVELQNSVSGAFWERAAQPIRDLANAVFPMLLGRMTEVAHEMGGIAVAVATAASSFEAMQSMDSAFENLIHSIDIAGDGVGSLTWSFIEMGRVGASYLPRLAGAFNEMAWSLEDWVARNVANGNMWEWINQGIVNLKALGGVLWNTVGVFHAIGAAAQAAGSGGLVGLADGLQRANRALHSEEWQAGLTSMFSGARESMALVGEGFGNFARGLLDAGGVLREALILSGSSVGMLLTALGGLFSHPAVQGGLSDFFTGLNRGVAALTDSAGPLGSVLGGLLSTMGVVASTLGSVVSNAVSVVGPAFVSLIEGVRPFIPVLGQIVSAIVSGLAPILTVVANTIQNVLLPPLLAFGGWLAANSSVITGLVTVLGTMAVVVGTVALAVKAFHGVLAVLRGVMIGVNFVMAMNPFVIVAAAIAGLVVAVVLAYQRIGWFRDFVDAAWAGIKTAFKATIDWITGVAWPALLNGLQWVGDKFAWLWQKAQDAWGWIRGTISAAVGWFTGAVVPAFQGALDRIGGFFDFLYRNFIAPFVWLFRGAISNVSAWFSGTVVPTFDRAVAVLGGVFRALFNVFVKPVMDAVRIAIDAVSRWFSGVVVPAFRTAVTTVGNIFRWFRDQAVVPVWNGVRAIVNAVVSWFRGTIVPAFRAAIQSVADKFNTFRAGVRVVWDAVKSLLRSGWDWIDRNVFQKFRDGLTVLEATFKSVREGIADSWDMLKAAVKAPITFVVNKVVNPFINGYNAINNAWSGDDIDTIPGFRKGGYTGRYGRDEVAGLVHGDEHVIRSESRRSIENTSPGLLDAMNKYGAAALGGARECAHHDHGADVALSSYGGVQSFEFGLQHAIRASKKLAIMGSAPGWDLPGAVRMVDNATSVRVFRAPSDYRGQEAVGVRQNEYLPPGVVGRYAGYGIQYSNSASRHLGVAGRRVVMAHEIGHALGLPHNARMHGGNGAWSMMNYDNMFRHNSVTSADVAALRQLYGGSGKAGVGGGGDESSRLGGMLKKIINGPLGQLVGMSKGNLFGGMAKGIVDKVVDGLVGRAKELFTGKGLTIDDLPGMASVYPDQKWDAPVGAVHKLSPGVSSIYNGTGGTEFFQRVQPGGSNVVELSAADRALLAEIRDALDFEAAGDREVISFIRRAKTKTRDRSPL